MAFWKSRLGLLRLLGGSLRLQLLCTLAVGVPVDCRVSGGACSETRTKNEEHQVTGEHNDAEPGGHRVAVAEADVRHPREVLGRVVVVHGKVAHKQVEHELPG